MAERHGIAIWPGVKSVLSCTYTVSHGISPGCAVLTCLPQVETPALRGDLIISDGVASIRIPDCKVDRIDATRDGSGITWQIQILDRRWRWRELGGIAGWYNQPDPHGLYIPWTVKLPSQLVDLCLKAMGERNYVINVPNKALPPCNWDYQPPGVVLTQLCETLGCRVVYRLDTDTVLITPIGQGGELPVGSTYSEGPSLDSPERPDSILLVGAPVRYQARFKMQAVGLDWDGAYRPLNALSYKPTIGWDKCGPPVFAGIAATNRRTRLENIALAQQSVYRCYQLVNLDPDNSTNKLNIPGYGRVERREQVVLEDTKVEQVQPNAVDEKLFDADGQKIIKHLYNAYRRDVPAEVYGSYNIGQQRDEGGAVDSKNTPPTKRIPCTFSIDQFYQVVTFDEYLYRITGAGDERIIEEAHLTLETACLIRNPLTNQIERYTREYKFGGPLLGTGPLLILHEDVQLNVIGEYETDVVDEAHGVVAHKLKKLKHVSGTGFQLSDTIARSEHYLRGEAAKYQLVGALQRTYNGIVPIVLDGKIQQVTWTIGEPGGAETQASLNTEHSVYVPPYPKRLTAEFAPAVQKKALNDKPPGLIGLPIFDKKG